MRRHLLSDEKLKLLLKEEREKTNQEWVNAFLGYGLITATDCETPYAVLASIRMLMFKEYLRTLKERCELIEQYKIPNPAKAGMPLWLPASARPGSCRPVR